MPSDKGHMEIIDQVACMRQKTLSGPSPRKKVHECNCDLPAEMQLLRRRLQDRAPDGAS